MKRCGKCHIEQDLCFFGKDSKRKDGLKPYCSECRKKECKIYREKNSNKISNYHKTLYSDNSDKILERNRSWRSNNIEKKKDIDRKYREENNLLIIENRKKFFESHPNIKSQYQKKYRENNKENIKIKNKEPFNRLKHNIRSRVYKFLNVKNIRKNNTTFNIIGCLPNQLKEHLQKKFIHGMSLDNYGDWHIDHIIPLSSATNEEEIYKLCHYTNLQPLWSEDNLKKSNKIL